MGEERYEQVDEYLDGLYGEPDPVLERALRRAEEAGLPAIEVSANVGRLLHVLALARGARSILEVGTLGGYSTIWLARALPEGGRLVTCELEPAHAEVARANVADAGLDDRVEVRVGPASETLEQLASEGATFDMVFLDADKQGYRAYLEAALPMARPGTLVVADNVVRGGKVALGPADDAMVTGVQRFNEALASDERLASAIVQIVGRKGHDGLAFGVVRGSESLAP